ncbi:hypothetical protein EDD22DRAFT_1007075 [Suillus occidentalis]|nr:hypothetical protein EDD22DRAFT_1007075 [Suillus occidentalis]
MSCQELLPLFSLPSSLSLMACSIPPRVLGDPCHAAPDSQDVQNCNNCQPFFDRDIDSATTFGYLTRQDLDHTKNLVLDLLCWGVSPECLAEAGVSAGVLCVQPLLSPTARVILVFGRGLRYNFSIVSSKVHRLSNSELLLIEGISQEGLGNWSRSQNIGTRTNEDVEEHYNSVYVDSRDCPLPRMDVEFNIDPVEFQASKRRRMSTTSLPPPPKVSPTSAPGVHEIATFLPGMLEFEHELDNEAEDLVKDLEFGICHA